MGLWWIQGVQKLGEEARFVRRVLRCISAGLTEDGSGVCTCRSTRLALSVGMLQRETE